MPTLSRQDALTNSKTLIRLFYYNLRNSYTNNNRKSCHMWLQALKNESSKIDQTLDSLLSPYQLDDLASLVDAVEHDHYARILHRHDDADEGGVFNQPLGACVEHEKHLQTMLLDPDNLSLVAKLTFPDMTLYDMEHITYHGRVDLVCQLPRTIIIIELKRGLGDHSLVGQCLKYMEHFEKRMLWNLWDRVECITIASQYTHFAYKELKRLGIQTLKYGLVNDQNLRFEKL